MTLKNAKLIQERICAEGTKSVLFFLRADGTYGFNEYYRAHTTTGMEWLPASVHSGRYENLEIAVDEAIGRVDWFRREMEWPARDKSIMPVIEHAPGWAKCPFCGINFSTSDENRWGGNRHLTCGQELSRTPFKPCPDHSHALSHTWT